MTEELILDELPFHIPKDLEHITNALSIEELIKMTVTDGTILSTIKPTDYYKKRISSQWYDLNIVKCHKPMYIKEPDLYEVFTENNNANW